MNIEGMRREAEKFAEFRVAKIEESLAVLAARKIAEEGIRNRLWEERNAVLEAELRVEAKRLEKLRPQLEEQARREHAERFKPLQELLHPFEAPVRQVRDIYSPDSKIATVDHYDDSYRSDGRHNVYYRGLIVPVGGGFVDQGHRIFGVYAVAIESSDRRELIFGVDISVSYQEKAPEKAAEDFEDVTPERDLFSVSRDQFYFVSSHSSPGYISVRAGTRIEYERGTNGLLKIKEPNQETFIERRFMATLKRLEVDNLLVKNGLDHHSQNASYEGAYFE